MISCKVSMPRKNASGSLPKPPALPAENESITATFGSVAIAAQISSSVAYPVAFVLSGATVFSANEASTPLRVMRFH
jgi:hypothetical protein